MLFMLARRRDASPFATHPLLRLEMAVVDGRQDLVAEGDDVGLVREIEARGLP